MPVGPDNFLEPGLPDRGQPTHFFPRRNQFVFRVRVPADFGDQEIVWSLTTNGVTEKAYATLRPQYAVDAGVLAANFGAGISRPDLVDNVAPQLTLETPTTLAVSAGEPVTSRRWPSTTANRGRAGSRPPSAGSRYVPGSAAGLRFSWFRYRGPGPVIFDPPQTKVWEDDRDGGNSPWSAGWEPPPIPPDNRWTVTATFSAPGHLRAPGPRA